MQASLIAGLILLSGQSRGASVFEALGLSPGQVARAGSLPPVSALATLPASGDERQQLIAAMLDPVPGAVAERKSCYAAQLLELWGERGRALEILEKDMAGDFDRMHLTRLRYRCGRLDAARESFAGIQLIAPPIGPLNDLPPCRIQVAVQPFIVQESFVEMGAFLAWLQPQCRISEWRSAVLAERLNLALHGGTLDALLAELTREPAITRAIAERMLDPGSPLVMPLADMPVLDLAWLVEIDGCTDLAGPLLSKAIQSGVGSDAERAELLRQFILKWNQSEPRTRLLGEWIEREDEFIRLLTGLKPVLSFSANLPFDPLCRIAERHPDDAYLNFLAGFNQTSRLSHSGPLVVTCAAQDCLVRAFANAPLPVGKPGRDGGLNDRSTGSYRYPWWKDDPARFALQQLAERLSAKKLHALLFSRDDFKALPVPDRLRYLDAAGLDLVVLEEIFGTNWRDPENDPYGGSVVFPTSSFRHSPRDLLERFDALMPEIILGSPAKPAVLVAAHSAQPLGILFGNKGPHTAAELNMLRRWHTGLLERGPQYARQVLAEGPRYRRGELDFGLMSEVMGKEAAECEAQIRSEVASTCAKAGGCSWFGPSGLSGFPVGYAPHDDHRYVPMVCGPNWIGDDGFGTPPAAWLISRHPALASLLDADFDVGMAAVASWAAAVRAQLPAMSDLATGYDIAIAKAQSHVGAMLKTRADADFVMFRASSGISLKHAKPPADPDAIEELATLRESPVPVRLAAADLALKCPNKERRDRLLGVLQSKGSAFPKSGPPPPGPNPPPAPSMARVIESLKAAPDLEGVCQILTDLPETYQMSPFSVISIPEVLVRFEKPHHERLLQFLRLDQEPIPGSRDHQNAARGPSFVDVRRLHAFFMAQDSETAANFRSLAIERGWAGDDYSGEIAKELLQNGQREAAIEWLANMVIQRFFPPPVGNGIYRFPTQRMIPGDYLLDEYLPVAGLELIASEKLALPIQAAIAAMPGVDAPVLSGFLKFYDDPSIESFERHLGGLTSPINPHLASTLRVRLPYLLSRLEHTKALAKELQKTSGKEP